MATPCVATSALVVVVYHWVFKPHGNCCGWYNFRNFIVSFHWTTQFSRGRGKFIYVQFQMWFDSFLYLFFSVILSCSWFVFLVVAFSVFFFGIFGFQLAIRFELHSAHWGSSQGDAQWKQWLWRLCSAELLGATCPRADITTRVSAGGKRWKRLHGNGGKM